MLLYRFAGLVKRTLPPQTQPRAPLKPTGNSTVTFNGAEEFSKPLNLAVAVRVRTPPPALPAQRKASAVVVQMTPSWSLTVTLLFGYALPETVTAGPLTFVPAEGERIAGGASDAS